jgi:uncharacterized protein (DUF427 family)
MSEHVEPKPKTVKIPGPDHPISVERNASRVVVTVAGRIVADTRKALTLREAHYPAVQYIPRKDVDMALLKKTEHATYCPYKGDCVYFSIPLGGERSANAVWSYEAPYARQAARAGPVDEVPRFASFCPHRKIPFPGNGDFG